MWWCFFIIWMISLSCAIMWMIYKLYSISSSQILDSNLSWWRSLVTFLSFSPRPTLNTKERLWASDGLRVWARVWLSVTPETVAQEAPVSMGVSRQGYWSGLPCPPPGDLPHLGIEPGSLMSPALAGRFFTTSGPWEACDGLGDVFIRERRYWAVFWKKRHQRFT